MQVYDILNILRNNYCTPNDLLQCNVNIARTDIAMMMYSRYIVQPNYKATLFLTYWRKCKIKTNHVTSLIICIK